MRIILGSSSVFRRQVLEKAGFVFSVIAPEIDEKAIRFDDPEKLTRALAQAKARAVVMKLHEPAIVIGSDQVGWFQNKILEKPVDAEEAWSMLRSYRGQTLEYYSGVHIINTENGREASDFDVVEVSVSADLPDSAIEQAISLGRVMMSSGALTQEDFEPWLEIKENGPGAFAGLPVNLVKTLIAEVV